MVTFLELVGIGLGGASVFGLIVGAFSIYNGRATRRMLMKEEKETREILKGMREILGGVRDTLKSHEKILEKLSEQHSLMLKSLKTSGKKRQA